MVAENLGAIPPNTSYMVAIVDEQRYDAYLASTEGSSAMVRFKTSKPINTFLNTIFMLISVASISLQSLCPIAGLFHSAYLQNY